MNNLATAYDKTFNCVQCGMCLPSCPTYLTLKEEKHSPRGRINLLKHYAENRLTLDDIKDGIDVCLGCMNCQTVCPTNVDYQYIYHTAVEMLKEEEKAKHPVKYYGEKSMFKNTLNKKISLKTMKAGLNVTKSQVKKDNKLLGLLPKKEREFYLTLSEQSKNNGYIKNKKSIEDRDNKKDNQPIRIVFFKGCIMDVMFEQINQKSVELLEHYGVEVITVKDELCCGALQKHAGFSDDAKRLAIKNIEKFEQIECDYIVNAIGGCGAALKEYPLLFDKNEEQWQIKAEAFSNKCIDISVILGQLDLQFVKPLYYNVTYQPSCHLINVQKVTALPEEIIKSIPGIKYQSLKENNICCGSAGIYNIVQYESSMKILDRKMEYVKNIRPDIIVTSNPGCYMQMQLGVNREGLTDKIQVKHLVDIVHEASGL